MRCHAARPRALLDGKIITLQGREMHSSPLDRSLLSRVFGLGHLMAPHCPLPGCAGDDGDEGGDLRTPLRDPFSRPPNSLSSPPHGEPETGASVLGEKGTSSARQSPLCPLASLLHLQASFCEWERALGRTGYHVPCFLGQMKQRHLTSPLYLIVLTRTLHNPPLSTSRLGLPKWGNQMQSQGG